MPVLLMSVAMGVEVGHWSDVQLRLQRTADLAALAGAEAYGAGASAQTAANAAANVAEFNAATGGSARSWTPASQILSDNQISVQITKGVNNTNDPAVRVTVTQPVPLLFSRIAFGAGSVSMTATALTEVGTTVNGAQPCVLTLNGASTGKTNGNDTSLAGNVTITLTGCAMVSNGKTTMTGNVTLNAPGIYTAGTLSLKGNVSGTGTNKANQHVGSPQLPDPYATDMAMQNALSQATCSPATPVTVVGGNGTVNLYPDTCYGNISISGNNTIVFNGTGLYTINGSINISGNTEVGGAAVSGGGITLVSTGGISVSGNFNTAGATLTAPTAADAANGAVPGVLFATSSTGGVTMAGNAAFPFTGLVYAPNSNISLAGNAGTGSAGCSEIIGNTLAMAGNVGLAANCSQYGLLNYGSLPNTTTIGLVE